MTMTLVASSTVLWFGSRRADAVQPVRGAAASWSGTDSHLAICPGSTSLGEGLLGASARSCCRRGSRLALWPRIRSRGRSRCRSSRARPSCAPSRTRRDVDLVVVLHRLVDVVAAGRGDAHRPAAVERPHQRRHLVHQQVADDAGRAGACSGASGGRSACRTRQRPERAAPGLPVEHLARLHALVDRVVVPLAVARVAAVARLARESGGRSRPRRSAARLGVLRHASRTACRPAGSGRCALHDLPERERRRRAAASSASRGTRPCRRAIASIAICACQCSGEAISTPWMSSRASSSRVVAVASPTSLPWLLRALLHGRVEARLADVGERDDLDVRLAAPCAEARERVEVPAAHPAGADHPHADRLALAEGEPPPSRSSHPAPAPGRPAARTRAATPRSPAPRCGSGSRGARARRRGERGAWQGSWGLGPGRRLARRIVS